MTMHHVFTHAGAWRGGKRNGQGSFTDAVTREQYSGKYVGDVRCGRGTATYASGHVYCGQWADDLREGSGQMTLNDGTVLQGIWHKGDLIESRSIKHSSVQQGG
jgi:hypothetical protein